ncbi:PGPGW domain-containing protein, partial [Streptomyces cyaneofuscatus]
MNAESDERIEAAEKASPESAPGGTTKAEKVERELGSRAPGFIKASKPLHLSWQVGVFVVGLGVVVAGVLMLVLPGPGWLVIFGGMAIWATESGQFLVVLDVSVVNVALPSMRADLGLSHSALQ